MVGVIIMPYYITKEVVLNAITQIFVNANLGMESLEYLQKDIENETEIFLLNEMVLNEVANCKFLESDIQNFVDILFQLKDNRYYLRYVLLLFLKSKHYNDIVMLLNKTFVNHIGEIVYKSQEITYEFKERYFDRFMEAVTFTNISIKDVLHFIFYVNTCDESCLCFNFKRPSLEFLKNYINKNEVTYLQFIHQPNTYVIGYWLYIMVMGETACFKLIDEFCSEKYFKEEDVFNIINKCKHVFLPALKNYIIKQTGINQNKATNLYLKYLDEVKGTLNELKNSLTDAELLGKINDEVNLSKSLKLNNEKEFMEFVEEDSNYTMIVNASQEYPLYFKSGTRANDSVISFILHEFQNLNSSYLIHKYEYFKELFSENELSGLCRKIYNKTIFEKITNENKWVVALICALGNDVQIIEVCNLITPENALINKSLYEFIFGCLIETKHAAVLKMLKNLYLIRKDAYFYKMLEMFAKQNGEFAEDYLDEMVPEYELNPDGIYHFFFNGESYDLCIDFKLQVKIVNIKQNNCCNIMDASFNDAKEIKNKFFGVVHELRTQIDRMKQAFYNQRYWNAHNFENNILNNVILNKIAQTLVFEVHYINSTKIEFFGLEELNSEIKNGHEISKIYIANVCNMQEVRDKFKYINFQAFPQLKQIPFCVNDENFSKTNCTELFGFVVNEIKFNNMARFNGWKMQSLNQHFYYKVFGEYLIRINFEKVENTNEIFLTDLIFYDLLSVAFLEGKFTFSGAKALTIGDIDACRYSIIINELYNCCIN